jgi:hypothetical protein
MSPPKGNESGGSSPEILAERSRRSQTRRTRTVFEKNSIIQRQKTTLERYHGNSG